MSRRMDGESTGVVENPGVVELGCGERPDPRADTYLDIGERDAVDVDVVWDLDEKPWPFDDDSVEGVIMRHVLVHLEDTDEAVGEIARILKEGGWAEIYIPFGTYWFHDPTQNHYWSYETPAYYARGATDYDYYFDFPLELENREFNSLWFTAPLLSKLSPLLRFMAKRFPGDWLCWTPWVAGDIKIRYRKIKG